MKRDVEGLKKRNAEIHRLRMEEHWTLQDIADLYDLTRERVRQILGNTGHMGAHSKKK